jgi:hypothetical protein
MGILRKYNEFLESPEMKNMDSEMEEPKTEISSDKLRKDLDELEKEGGTVEYKNYKITLPSELNYEGKPKTYLIDKSVPGTDQSQHVQAQSQDEVEQVVTEQVLFESLRAKQRRRK